jgi:prepilin-type N-terminal cleavage/methylation domain-containing protein
MIHTHPNRKGFTLVELIVVITILTILWTISFLSFQGIATDARDAKRSSDLANISQSISIVTEKGVGIMSFVSGTAATINNSATGTTSRIRISWIEWYDALSGSYLAGDVNYTVLWIKKENFSDPLKLNEAYKIGVTNYNRSFYEIAATVENDGAPDTIVEGTWNPRKSTPNYGSGVGDTFYLSGKLSLETWLKVRDFIDDFSWSYTITKVSTNMIQVTGGMITWSSIFLHGDETRHLIKKWDSVFAIDIWKGTTYTPYKFN